VLEYDDVVNKQREVIYRQRQETLHAANLREQIERMTSQEIHALVEQYLPDDREQWELEELYRAALVLYPVPAHIKPENWQQQKMTPDDIALDLVKGAIEVYDAQEAKLTPEIMRIAERQVTLRAIDQFWIRHLTDLDILREGIGLVAIGQRDPLVEYKREAFAMWEDLQGQIRRLIVQTIYRVELAPQPQPKMPMGVRNVREGLASLGGPAMQARPQPVRETAPEPIRADVWNRTGRNDPCPCGSGKKYKNCHYRQVQEQRQALSGNGKKRRK
jgi:preprotein translocase subunit SecA